MSELTVFFEKKGYRVICNHHRKLTYPFFLILLVLLLTSPVQAKYSGGTGEPNKPYQIADANDMNEIGTHPEDWGSHFLLVNDINLADYTGTQFNIIGTSSSNAFTGVFDGNGHSISNFTYIEPGGVNIGVFGVINGPNALIQNLALIDPTIDSNYPGGLSGGLVGTLQDATVLNCSVEGGIIIAGEVYTGGLAGSVDGGLIENCYATIQVSGGLGPSHASYASCFVGGLVGSGTNSTISNCYATGSVSGESGVGGLIGEGWNSTISNCYATGSVSGGFSEIGGLVGECMHGEPESPMVSNCYATGDVDGGDQTGGLIGSCHSDVDVSFCYAIGDVNGDYRTGGFVGLSNNGSISNCYAKGNVKGISETGGFIGWNSSQAITNAFSSGSVSGTNYTGGFVGRNGSVLFKCFWDNTVNPTLSGIGDGTDPNVIGKSTTEMKKESTFTNWDFAEIWNIGENQTYPYLRVYPAGDLNHDGQVNLPDFAIFADHWLAGVE
jgi:hypothetical protein